MKSVPNQLASGASSPTNYASADVGALGALPAPLPARRSCRGSVLGVLWIASFAGVAVTVRALVTAVARVRGRA
eukprot:10511239-Alexandrium_andersonii.AAC.1